MTVAKLSPAARTKRDDRILALHAQGYTERAIARQVGMSRSGVWAVLQARKAAGS